MPSQNHQRLAGKVVLLTGASSGIGMAAVSAFAKEGCPLMLAARRVDRLANVANSCRALGVPCEIQETDVQNRESVLRLADATIQKFGRIDILVNNAGMGGFAAFHSQPWDAIQRTARTNFEGPLAVCHAVIPSMIKQGSGFILNVSSVVGKRAVPMLASYSASKFALWGFSEALRMELLPHGIQVCHFCPRATATEFHEAAGVKPSADSLRGMDSPERVAAAMVDAVVQRKREHIMSLTERVLIKMNLLAPVFTQRLLNLARKKNN